MGILIVLVIATMIIAGAYVGYHAWDKSLHEESEKHSEKNKSELYFEESIQNTLQTQTGLKYDFH